MLQLPIGFRGWASRMVDRLLDTNCPERRTALRKTGLFLIVTLLLGNSLHAQPTWRTGNLGGDALVIPGKCAATWYDPEVFLFPNGDPGFLAQGGQNNPCTANVGLDSLFLARYNSSARS